MPGRHAAPPLARVAALPSATDLLSVAGAIWGAGLLLLASPVSAHDAVGAQLCIAVDGSGSISGDDFSIMKSGLAGAIRDPAVMPQDGSVEIGVVQFGKGTIQFGAVVEVGATVITGAAVAGAVADQIEAIVQGDGSTPTHDGITLCASLMTASSQFPGAPRQIVNIPTDGVPDDPDEAVAARDAALAAGVDEIDAEAIGAAVDPASAGFAFLRDRLVFPQPGYQAPPFIRGGFVISVQRFADFPPAVAQKIEHLTRRTANSTATPTQTPTSESTPTFTPKPTETSTLTVVPTVTATLAPPPATATLEPSPTATVGPTFTLLATAAATATNEPSATPVLPATETSTPRHAETPTPTPTIVSQGRCNRGIVSAQLCIAMDGSGSIVSGDFGLMKAGLAGAVRDPGVTPQDGSVEIAVVQFGKGTISFGAVVEVEATVIADAATAGAVADRIEAIEQGEGSTPTHDGIALCTAQITGSAEFEAAGRQVVNIPTDGVPDDREAAAAAGAAAVAVGVDEIDAEAIGRAVDPSSEGFAFLRDRLVHPQPGYQAPPFSGGGFVIPVQEFADLPRAIAGKMREVSHDTCVCTGDCDRDEDVVLDELLAGVQIALGNLASGTCRAFDADADGEVTVEDLLAGVYNHVHGCPGTGGMGARR